MSDTVGDRGSRSFDLSELRAQFEPILRSRRRFAMVFIVFMLAVASFLVAVSVRPLELHTLPTSVLAALVYLLMVIGIGTWLILPNQAKWRSGAERIDVDSRGLTLAYSSGTMSRVEWTDSKLRFDLIDMSGVATGRLFVGTPYSIRVEGLRSLLTPEAYEAVLTEVRDRGLARNLEPGPALLGSRPGAPRVVHVCPPSTTAGLR
jgi:hypothetical protein